MTDAPHVLIVEARFYEDIADELARGAIGALEEAGASFQRVSVPGAFELSTAVRYALRAMDVIGGRRRFDAYVALGCVIRGETSHYDYVCGESARGLADLSREFSLALGFGVLTCENREQAWARAAVDQGNKGGAAAEAALRMLQVKAELGLTPR